MNVDGKNIRPIWFNEEKEMVQVIDQRQLPHEFIIEDLTDLK
ncbi:MAG: S-methyl-5-thioribose-1-phosphate isomerase, partial [Desulfobacteraceae bacterium]|nr:S-methyl-5-thioribose-1-phosphate isomerase [Desulfobacteraceae bacterium]